MTKKRAMEFSGIDAAVLAVLPKEPLSCAVPDVAEDVLGKADSPSLGRVRRTLRRFKGVLYAEFISTRPYGRKDTYGIRADRWRDVQDALSDGEGRQDAKSNPDRVDPEGA